jgi:alpha-tubulin suppressor-like RCC1 family protein
MIDSGVCWCWGDNQHGQLGLGIEFLKSTRVLPTQVKFFVRLQKKIQDIATGTTFSAFLDGTHIHSLFYLFVQTFLL